MPPIFSKEEGIRILATQFRNNPKFTAHRKLIEDYMRLKGDPEKRHQLLGLMGELWEQTETLGRSTTPEVEDHLLMHDVPALELAERQERNGTPLDAEALQWIADEKQRLARESQQSEEGDEEE